MKNNKLMCRFIMLLAGVIATIPAFAYVSFYSNYYYPGADDVYYTYPSTYVVPSVNMYTYPYTSQVIYPATTTTRTTYAYYGSGGYYPASYYPEAYSFSQANCYREWNGIVCY